MACYPGPWKNGHAVRPVRTKFKLISPTRWPCFSKGYFSLFFAHSGVGYPTLRSRPNSFRIRMYMMYSIAPALFGSIWIDCRCGWSSQPHSFAFSRRVVTGTWCKMIGNVWFLHRCIANHHAIHSRHHLNSNSTCFRLFSLTEIWSHPFYSGNHHRRMSLSTHFPSLNLL